MKLSETHWDCECDARYIHPNAVEKCEKCGTLRDESPDAREDEVADPGNHALPERAQG